jgi:hypothetical protein
MAGKARKASKNRLGDFEPTLPSFPRLGSIFKRFQTKQFQQRNFQQKINAISLALLSLIKKTKGPTFLLPAVLDFIAKIKEKKILSGYTFAQFELWLNQFSELDDAQNYLIRSKIVGKYIPREEYQELFPIGMDKWHKGTHFVTAHSSPDLDTIVASFWGWVDAFGARLTKGLHLWNVPGGPPKSIVELEFIFTSLFGRGIFEFASKDRTALSITGMDLTTRENVVTKKLHEATANIEHERYQNAVVVVDEKGNYRADWRSSDVEGLSQITGMFNHFLRWFEINLQARLISLLAKKGLKKEDLPKFVDKMFSMKLTTCEPLKEFTPKQRRQLDEYLIQILKAPKGIRSSFYECAEALSKRGLKKLKEFKLILDRSIDARLFDKEGVFVEDRPRIFNALSRVIQALHQAIREIKQYLDTLKVAIQMKEQVFGHKPQYVSLRSTVEEIKSKIGNHQHISVVYTDDVGAKVPVGVIYAKDLSQAILGTVSLRDFSNRSEVKIPTYLEVISAFDHHKITLKTEGPPTLYVADAQSANVLVAEKALFMSDRYSLGGMTKKEIERQLERLKDKPSPSAIRLRQKLLGKLKIARLGRSYYINPAREFIEYLHYIYAILDDTDLLSKVSARDVRVVAELLNRMKSISKRSQVQIISLDDLPRNKDFPKKAASRILRHEDMYSIYQKVYMRKQEEVESNIELCGRGRPSSLFLDTKEQNGCCRVGQTKLFNSNIETYKKYALDIQKIWCNECAQIYKDKPELDLFLHMISTVPSAEVVYSGKKTGEYWHKDELWIWVPPAEQAIVHFKQFLSAFKNSPGVVNNEFELECMGKNAKEMRQLFKESFISTKSIKSQVKGFSLIVLRYKAASMNSRKAMITPFLPKLVN